METILIIVCALALLALQGMAVRHLAGERWQILATMPWRKEGDHWSGINFTWYGVLSATANTLAAALFIVLMAAVGVPLAAASALCAAMFLLCLPAARYMAWIVEKKPSTFTVGGAVFVGVLAAPWMVLIVNRLLAPWSIGQLPPLPTLAALSISYVLGEGIGRLACISFGCCYGKPLAQCSPWIQRLFKNHAVSFSGACKKAAYEGGCEQLPLVPVQAMTATLHTVTAAAGILFFLHGAYLVAALAPLFVAQVWRFFSEMLRADYRGGGRISSYQIFGAVALVYLAGCMFFFRQPPLTVDLGGALATLWQPGALLALQLLWWVVFFYTGKSMVTNATISLHLRHDRI